VKGELYFDANFYSIEDNFYIDKIKVKDFDIVFFNDTLYYKNHKFIPIYPAFGGFYWDLKKQIYPSDKK
ncbi:MAG: hypothetical protein ACKVTZ_22355, partial [Bacteroidia bacterium]